MSEALDIKIEEAPPRAPESVEETGLSFQFLADLALKTSAAESTVSTAGVAERMRLPLPLVEELMQNLYREKVVEIRGTLGINNHRYALLDRGWEQLKRLRDISGYVGPAPVSLAAYSAMVRAQARPSDRVPPETVAATFSDLVLPEDLLHTLGLAINSRRSLFISGVPGTGKTAIAERINNALHGGIWIPYAIAVDDHIINLYDAHNHQRSLDEEQYEGYDRRWLRYFRPLIIVGGEMTIESTDLIYNSAARYYDAPFQVKANCGTLVVDDFGRQRVDPTVLLNRWIVPLERYDDFLTLHTGKKIRVPFEQLVVFSTNLKASDLVDDAFLRRIGYRVKIEPPNEETYRQIFERRAETMGMTYQPQVLDYLIARYKSEDRIMKSCEPRDLLNRFQDICQYRQLSPVLTTELLDLAWSNYFGTSYGG